MFFFSFFGLLSFPCKEQIGVPSVTVTMTTAGTPATGGKFVFHDIDWPHCSIYTKQEIFFFLAEFGCLI